MLWNIHLVYRQRERSSTIPIPRAGKNEIETSLLLACIVRLSGDSTGDTSSNPLTSTNVSSLRQVLEFACVLALPRDCLHCCSRHGTNSSFGNGSRYTGLICRPIDWKGCRDR